MIEAEAGQADRAVEPEHVEPEHVERAVDTGQVELTADTEQVAREAVARAGSDLPDVIDRLAAFSDPTRFELLIAIHAAPGAPVKTLAAATGLTPNTVSQSLVSLREAGLVTNERDGRLSRWRLSDSAAHALLHHLGAPHSELHPPH